MKCNQIYDFTAIFLSLYSEKDFKLCPESVLVLDQPSYAPAAMADHPRS